MTFDRHDTAAARRFSVAPMIDWTDRHCRYFHRLLTRRALLYTEMVTSSAIIHGDTERLLAFDPAEHPVAVQLGGSDPDELARAAKIAEFFGYNEVNLNVGCPSDRVQSGRFGACLMAEPELVAECVDAMKAALAVPVTVKCRIGIDDQDSDEDLDRFVAAVREAGVAALIVHARKAWLKGLSPKENRDVPPLDWDRVYRLKVANPGLPIVLNGGVTTLEDAEFHLSGVDGVMLGRAAYQRPAILADVDRRIFAEAPVSAVEDVVSNLRRYIGTELSRGTPLHHLTKPALGLFHGAAGARKWRRILTVSAQRAGAGLDVFDEALEAVGIIPARSAA